MVKEDDKVLLIDNNGIKFIGIIDLIEDNEYYININDRILIFNYNNGYLERDNKLYYCKEYFIENNFIKINFYLNDLQKSNYLSKKLIYELLEFNDCDCNNCLNIKIIKLCKFLNEYNFINELENYIKNFALNNLLIELINLKIDELDRYLENLRQQVSNNNNNKILNLKTNYDNSIHKHNTCCICLEEINDSNKLIINCPICNHIFCADICFERFIENDDRCPYCRIDLKEWIKIE
tara:strand:- start:331 stop:1041 length:711 start_codon:yes stop_codon:yes gene_type:complete